MPKKGKGRGRGRGRAIPSESDVPASEDRRPGPSESDVRASEDRQRSPSEEISRGRGRGRGGGDSTVSGVRDTQGIQQRIAEKDTSKAKDQKRPDVRQPAAGFFGMKRETVESVASATEVTESSQDTSCRKKIIDKSDQEALLSQVAGLSLEYEEPKKFTMAKRPGYGRIDDRNRITLFVNYFKLNFKDTVIYHYDIDISESTKDKKIGRSLLSEGRTLKQDIQQKVKHVERQKRRNIGKAKCRQIIAEMFKTNEVLKKFHPVYDGQKNLFTSRPLPCKKGTAIPVAICIEDQEKLFFVTIAPVEKKDKTNIISLEPLKLLYSHRSSEIPLEVLLVYETIMSHREPPFNQVQVRNSFFSLQNAYKGSLGVGLEIWAGYHQHVQLTEHGPVVVINLAAKAFHKAGPVIDYSNEVLKCDDLARFPKLRRSDIDSLTQALKGVQIQVTHQKNPRKYKIKGVTDKSANDITLDVDNKRMSVAQYFVYKYKKKLLYPHLPCLIMQTSNNTTFMPMETCIITKGQPKVGKLNAELTSKMIRQTAVDPQRRMTEISKTAVQVNGISDNYMSAFGLLMDINLTKVDGRIIAAPQLAYHGDPQDKSRIAKPDIKGVWRVDDGKKFYRTVKIDKWVLVSFADGRRFNHDLLSRYCQFLVQSGRKCGMVIDRPLSIDICGRNVSTESALCQAKKSGAQMAIVVLDRRDNNHSYDEVKFLADFKLNLVTQCMEDKTLLRINDQITTNVCLKINVKLGGINHILYQKLQIFSQPVTVLGVDVIHWTRGYGYPSIVSVVGSLNPTASRYALTCDLQRNEKHEKVSQEVIRDMKKISKEVLDRFREVNNRNPEKIIVFRDGVSDGQFQHALEYEVSGIQKACQDLFHQIIPITYLVVQRRHQTRFRPVKSSQGVGKNQNIPPGTCVDKDITHPVFFDYFICSHEGIQGTSKPAHYTVLHDDNKFHTEELQQLCHFLCHTFVRCTRSVSLPAPLMYADLAASRAKKYADLFTLSDTASTAGSDDIQKDLPSEVQNAIRGMKSFENNMFYV